MAFCENCGHQLNEGAKFCSECGTPIFNGARQKKVQFDGKIHNKEEFIWVKPEK